MLMLAAWSVCTVHCALENLPGATSDECCGNQEDSAQCICSSIQSAGASLQKNLQTVPPAFQPVCLFESLPREDDSFDAPGLVRAAFGPQKTSPPWQFSFRAALPVRAPSLNS